MLHSNQKMEHEAELWQERYEEYRNLSIKDGCSENDMLNFEEYLQNIMESDQAYWLLSDDTNYATLLKGCEITEEEYKSFIVTYVTNHKQPSRGLTAHIF